MAWSAFLSFFLSLILSCYPSSGHHQKGPKCRVCARGSRRTGRPFFLFSRTRPLSPPSRLKKERGNEPTKERKGKKHMYEKEKDNLAPSITRGQRYQSKSTSATTRLLFQIKTTYGRQMTLTRERNPKRLVETLCSSLSKESFDSPPLL